MKSLLFNFLQNTYLSSDWLSNNCSACDLCV